MWQSFWHTAGKIIHEMLTWLAALFDCVTAVTIVLALGLIPYLLLKKHRRELFSSSDSVNLILLGVGITSLALMVFHRFKVPTLLDSHGDFLECTKCHETIEEIFCPKCGAKYDAMPTDQLPWARAEYSD